MNYGKRCGPRVTPGKSKYVRGIIQTSAPGMGSAATNVLNAEHNALTNGRNEAKGAGA